MTPRAWPVRRFAPITGRRAWMAERAEGARWHAGVDLAAPGSPCPAFEGDSRLASLEKFLFLGDDRNITAIFVAGRRVRGAA